MVILQLTTDFVEWGWTQPAPSGGIDDVHARFYFPE